MPEEIHVTVVCRGTNAPADAVRIVNVALAMQGVSAVEIEKKELVTRGPERRIAGDS